MSSKRKLRVGLVCRWYTPEDWGGVPVYIHALACGLRDYGHDVTVVTSTANKLLVDTTRDEEGIRVVRLKRFQWPWLFYRIPVVGKHVTSLWLLVYDWTIIWPLKRLVRELSLDVLEYADVNAEAIGHRISAPSYVPYVVRLQTPLFVAEEFYTQAESMSSYALIGWAERKAIQRADHLVSPSQSMANIIKEKCGIDESAITIIRNPLDSEYLEPLIRSSEFGFPRDSVIFFGRLEKRKGAFVFADAIPDIHQTNSTTHFFFVGPDRHSPEGGSSQLAITAQLERAGVDMTKVHFLGQVPRSKLKACYTEAPIAVIPPLYEDYPYSVIEAMACGTAVVTSDCYGIPEIVRSGETGYLVKAGNSADLADRVRILIENPPLQKQIGEAAAAFIRQECSQETAAHLTTAIYEKTILQRTSARR